MPHHLGARAALPQRALVPVPRRRAERVRLPPDAAQPRPGERRVRIVNLATGKVADVADCSTADGADVRRWTWLNNACRQWRLTPA
ncbi:RICIN domain-containing protein [Streptomyces sp. enrichment culture]|uniref:RICIN domain-containing protein n=1 Tax=Streptomyces sp. enrichment culture TaxID=1795815 RepID=UPI003F577A5A